MTRWRDLVGDGPTTGWEGEFMKGFVLLGRMDGGRLILGNDRCCDN